MNDDARTGVRRGSEDVAGSGWWYCVAFYPVAGLLIWVVGLSLLVVEPIPLLGGILRLSVWGLFYATGIAGLLTPLFLYLDAEGLQDTDWSPNSVVYLSLGFIGILVPPLLLGVTLRYLYLRFVNVGLS